MLKRLIIFIVMLIAQQSFSQAIDVNPAGAPESDDNIPELINETLTDPCSSGTNITYRYCNNVSNSNTKSFGYFQYTPPIGEEATDANFPFKEGIILSTGSVVTSEGPNTANPGVYATGSGVQTHNQNGPMTGNGANNWIGDTDIKEILDDRLGGNFDTFNATVVEFDFISLTSDLSFDYLFASEEWESASNECPGSLYLDGFAFIVTGPGITPDLKNNGQPFAHGGKNIALIPGTNIPVSAGSIYNNSLCSPASANDNLYNPYTYGNATNSPINFNARTVKLTAQETVIAGETYHLKLVVADRGDSQLDSAVFLAADSFTTAPTLTINGVELNDTQPICEGSGNGVTINGQMNIGAINGAIQYQWLHNGTEMTQANGYPQDENQANLTTSTNGTYTVIATIPLATGNCDSSASVTINFLPDTTIGTVPNMNLCDSGDGTASFPIDNYDNTLLNGQDPNLYSVSYHLTEDDAVSGNNPITSPYIGVTQEIFTRVVLTNDPSFCFATGSFFANVNTVPTATQPANPIRICDDLSNGQYLEQFDLTQVQDEILNGQLLSDLNITYYDNSTTPPTLIPNAMVTAYVSGPKTIGVTVTNVNNTNCYASTTFEILTDLIPLMPTVTELTVCDDDNDGISFFDLNAFIPNLTNNNPDIDVSFYETQAQADQNIGAIDISQPYQNVNTNIPGEQTLYLTLTTNGTVCQISTTLILIVIDSPELPSEPIVYSLCDAYDVVGDGIVAFDLTSYENSQLYATIIDNANGDTSVTEQYTATYYTALDASGNPEPTAIINNPNAFENTFSPDQTIYVSVEHIGNTTIPATGCATVKEITLHVNLLPTAHYTPIEMCDTDGVSDDMFTFNLTNYISQITDGASDVDVTFYEVITDAQNGSGPSLITNPTAYINLINNQLIFARVYRPSTGCYAIAHIELKVAPLPISMTNQDIVDQLGNSGVMEECDGDVDGSGSLSEQVSEFDLTLWEEQILTGDGPGVESGVSAAYYTSFEAAEGGDQADAITTPEAYTNTSNPQTIYVRVTNDGTGIVPATDGSGCYVIVQFDIFVPVPDVQISGNDILCIDENGLPLSNATLPVLVAETDNAGYDYQWSLNGVEIPGATFETYTVTQAGEYTVTISGPSDFDCINYASTIIEVSGMPADYDASVTTTAFANNHQIQATATSSISGLELYYTLDLDVTTGEGVETNITGLFTDVSPGLHTVTISDGKGCWSDTISVTIIDYPHFFTPNGDGVNDTWHIIGKNQIPYAQIYIFDRYGKLMTRLSPDGAGWDGTYNGHAMPADDYWFTIEYRENTTTLAKETIKAHFSIKR